MLELDGFLKENVDWRDLLSRAPYNLKITDDGQYVMLKYNQIDSDFSLPEVKEARGIIYDRDTLECVCRPFSKFFNYGEENAATIDWSKAIVTEKIDGSLIKVWDRNISTNGTIDAFKAEADPITHESFGQLFVKAVAKYIDISKVFEKSHGVTLMFELVGPQTRVVVPYKELDVYYLGARDNETGAYVEIPDIEGWFAQRQYLDAKSLEEIIDVVNDYDWTHEGFVVFDGVERIKVKSPAYLMAHYMLNNGAVTWERLVNIVLANEIDEFLVYAEDYRSKIDTIRERMEAEREKSEKILDEVRDGLSAARKDYAMKVLGKPSKYRGYLFAVYDKKCENFNAYSCGWSARRWVEFLELNGYLLR